MRKSESFLLLADQFVASIRETGRRIDRVRLTFRYRPERLPETRAAPVTRVVTLLSLALTSL